MIKKLIKNLILTLVLIILFVPYVYSANFNHVPVGFWAYKEIQSLTEKGIISDSGNLFHPGKYITRAEFSEMIIKALKLENMPVNVMYSFEDVNNSHPDWKYIIRAVNMDILKPADNNYFYPDEFVTRSEMITFLVNLLRTEDITKQDAIKTLQNNYKDFFEVPDWFKVTAGKAEIINVIAKEPPREHYIDYDKNVTKAQAAVFLYNMLRETDSYKKEALKEATSPKIGDGLVIENTIQYQDVVTIPAQTVLPVTVMGHLSSKDSTPGQMFQARFSDNIIDHEHHILLSKDIVLIGKILDTKKAKSLINNGELLFELSAANNDNVLTRILAVAHCEAPTIEANKFKKAAKTIFKGRNFVAKDGQIIYIKLYSPMRVNIVTGEILD